MDEWINCKKIKKFFLNPACKNTPTNIPFPKINSNHWKISKTMYRHQAGKHPLGSQNKTRH